MKKALKITCVTVAVLVLALLAAVLSLPLWIGPVAKSAANSIVPGYTGTGFDLGEFGLNFYSGRVHVGAVRLDNPADFSPEQALTLGSLDVDVDVLSALSDTVVVREIAVRDLFVSYVSANGRNNFDVIAENARKKSGGDAAGEAPSDETEGEAADGGGKPSKKVIIDKIVVSGTVVQWGVVKIPLPTIVLTDIGRETQGVDIQTALMEVLDAIRKNLTALGKGIVDIGAAFKDVGLKGVGDAAAAASAMLDSATSGKAVGATTEALKSAGGAAAEGAGKAVGATTEALKSAGGAAAEGAGKAVDATTEALKSAGGAATKGAGKAVDATTEVLKNAGDVFKGFIGK